MTPAQHFTNAGAAAAFAVRAQFPYVTHPLGVGQILRVLYPDNDDLEAAGYLHDVVEDTDVTIEVIEDRFGPDVAILVAGVTNKVDYSNPDIVRLKAADVLDNVLDTIRGLHKGHDVWSRFRKGRAKVNYWKEIFETAVDTLAPHGYGSEADGELLRRLDTAIGEVMALSYEGH
jgi:hypothetical protein